MVAVVIAVLIFVLGLYVVLNFYIGKRLWDGILSNVPFVNAKVYWAIFFVIAFAFFLSQIPIDFSFVYQIKKVLGMLGAFWIAIFMYSLISLVIIDIFRLILKRIKPEFVNNFSQSPNRLIFSIVVAVSILGIVFYGWINAKNTKIVNYDITLGNFGTTNQLNVVFVSDLHIGNIIGKKDVAGMVEKINQLNADVVVLGGDIVDGSITPFKTENVGEELKKIKSKYGVYGVLGNHDVMSGSLEEKLQIFKDSNIHMLVDEHVVIDNYFYLVGRKDKSQSKRMSIKELTKEIPKGYPKIVIDHQPNDLKSAQTEKIELIVSGHTHAGQMYPGRIMTKRIYLNDWGYKLFGDTHSIVSSGIGTWGAPVKTGSDSEILNIKLKTN